MKGEINQWPCTMSAHLGWDKDLSCELSINSFLVKMTKVNLPNYISTAICYYDIHKIRLDECRLSQGAEYN